MKTNYSKWFLILVGVIALSATALAVLPYNQNTQQRMTPTTVQTLAIGNMYDGSLEQAGYLGVPSAPVVAYFLDAPNAADADYFVNDQVATATGTFTPNTNTKNQINAATNMPFSRNVSVTPNQATTGTLTITYINAQGIKITSPSIAFVNASSAVLSDWTARELVSVNITAAFIASTTLDVGFEDKFGFPYPNYHGAILHAAWDADGADFPTVDGTNFAVTTDWTVTAGLPDSTSADKLGTFNITGATDTDPDGTTDYAIWYIGSYYYNPDGGKYSTSAWDLR